MSNITLRDYQEVAVGEVRTQFRSKNDPVLFVLPTGGGKTYTFCYIADNAARMLASKPLEHVVIIVHRKELLLQASASLRALGVDHGMISPHFTPSPHKIIQVASVDTLLIRLKKRPMKVRLAIFDEAHHVIKGNKWGRAYEEMGKPATLGVTATPVRTDGTGLGEHAGGIFKSLVLGPAVGELIERGKLINPIVYTSLEVPDMKGIKKNSDGDWNQKQLAARVDKPKITGDAVEQYQKVCPGARAIAFCASIEHARHVAAEFQKAGYRFAILVGEPAMSDAERTSVVKGLRNGSLDGACTVDLVSEGFDLPSLSCCIMLRPTASEALFLQQAGRVMRPEEGKGKCWLLDHVGNVGIIEGGAFKAKHGLPNAERLWTLDGRAKRKGKKKAEPEDIVDIVQCPECFVAQPPAPKCCECGHVFEVKGRKLEHAEGELTQVTADMVAAAKAKKQAKVKGAKTLEELQKIAAELGYSRGWAKHVFEAKNRTKAKYQRRPDRPPEPTLLEIEAMGLEELERVEREQGYDRGWASNYFHSRQQRLGGAAA